MKQSNLKKIITFIFIIIWAIIVFYFSNQESTKSSKLSGGVTKVVIEVFKIPEKVTVKQQETMETVIRKLAHFSIYTLGGILIISHINLYKITLKKKLIISLVIGICYAITDEMHQLFVVGRSGEIRDVIIDSIGVSFGITIGIIIFTKLYKEYKNS